MKDKKKKKKNDNKKKERSAVTHVIQLESKQIEHLVFVACFENNLTLKPVLMLQARLWPQSSFSSAPWRRCSFCLFLPAVSQQTPVRRFVWSSTRPCRSSSRLLRIYGVCLRTASASIAIQPGLNLRG